MMFGMTGAGKSALGNLIAGENVFDSSALIRRVIRPFNARFFLHFHYAERFFMFSLLYFNVVAI